MDGIRSNLEKELTCPICLQFFVMPQELPCKHNFCLECINTAWSGQVGGVRCPECNHTYEKKPYQKDNWKLGIIAKRFKDLEVPVPPVATKCALCQNEARKFCLRCAVASCAAHVPIHVDEVSSQAEHLMIDVEDMWGWICPEHKEYRLYHCEVENTVLCKCCCSSKGVPSHSVCDVELRHHSIKRVLQKEQAKLKKQMQAIEESLRTVEADQQQAEESFWKVTDAVKKTYQEMQELLVRNMERTLHNLESAHSKFSRDSLVQVSQLHERQEDLKQMLASAQMALNKAQNINFMKNTTSVKLWLNSSELSTSLELPVLGQANFQPRHFLEEVSDRKNCLQNLFEGPSSTSSVPGNAALSQSKLGTTRAAKRKSSEAFPESNLRSTRKKRYTPVLHTLLNETSAEPSYTPWSSSAPGPRSDH